MSEATPANLVLRIIYLSPQQALREADLRNVYHSLGRQEEPRLRYLRLVEHVLEESDVYRLTREGKAIAIKTETEAGIDETIINQTKKLPRIEDDPLLRRLARLAFGDGLGIRL